MHARDCILPLHCARTFFAREAAARLHSSDWGPLDLRSDRALLLGSNTQLGLARKHLIAYTIYTY